MNQLFADFDIKAWIRVLEDDVLLSFQQCLAVEGAAGARLRKSVDVSPFASAGSAWCGIPLLAEGVIESFVGKQLKQSLSLVGFFPRILVPKNVVLKMVF